MGGGAIDRGFLKPALPKTQTIPREPRWPATLALVVIGALHYALPSVLTPGPDWLPLLLIIVLSIPAILAHRRKMYRANETIGYVLLALVTVYLIVALALLIGRLPAHRESPKALLIAASGLWASNVLVFASWYWRLDAGGPNQREIRGVHTGGAFLFPQMMLEGELRKNIAGPYWSPGFVDYLFLAFNTSTAFSPTDVPVLSRWAKLMMMVQSCISLSTLAILAARAINIL